MSYFHDDDLIPNCWHLQPQAIAEKAAKDAEHVRRLERARKNLMFQRAMDAQRIQDLEARVQQLEGEKHV